MAREPNDRSMRRYRKGEVVRWGIHGQEYLVNCPHYKMIPRDTPIKNMAWRCRILKLCLEDAKARRTVMQMCEEDPLFFINTFCYLIEPRMGEDASGLIPFCTWCHQDPVIAAMAHFAGVRHVVGDKSRAQGASYLAIALLAWLFLFRDNMVLGMGSKTEDDADDPENPKSLGWKFDFVMKQLPDWMRPPHVLVGQKNRRVNKHTWTNSLRNNFLKAESATEGIGRGGRFSVFFLDESAHFPVGKDRMAVHNLLETTNCLWMLSTPNGMNNEHYDRIHNPGPWMTVVLDWKDNPIQRRGLYQAIDGKIELLDQAHTYPSNYPFVFDGRIRSEWYDRKCNEHGNNWILISQELDRSYTGSKGRPFGDDMLSQVQVSVREPTVRGNISVDPSDLHATSFSKNAHGDLVLWREVMANGRLPEAKYVVGCDISAGTAGDLSSNSVIEIFDGPTCEQIGELCSNRIPPAEFANLAIGVCWWLYGSGQCGLPYLIWEKNGPPGTVFTNQVVLDGYSNVFFQRTGDELRQYATSSNRPGYHNSRIDYALAPLTSALSQNVVTIRSKILILELSQYVYEGSKIVHPGSLSSMDPSSIGLNHGDRVVATGMALQAMKERGYLNKLSRAVKPVSRTTGDHNAPLNSTAGRHLRRQREQEARSRLRSCTW